MALSSREVSSLEMDSLFAEERRNELAAAAAARAYYGVIYVSIHKKQVITIFIEYKWHIE